MKNISGLQFSIWIVFFSLTILLQGCSKQEYLDIPKNPDGTAYITKVASTSSAGITTLDDIFTVNATLPNAKAGDEIIAELLAQQMPAGGTSTQLLPIKGTQKKLIVGSDLKVSVSYTRAETLLKNPNDVVTVTFAGKTESAFTSLSLGLATSIKGPLYNGNAVTLRRNAGAAYFDVAVAPKTTSYTGSITVLKKNGIAQPWSSAIYAYGTKVPISGDDYAIGKDTMYYAFVSKLGSYTDTVKLTVLANAPLYQLTKSGPMVLGATTGGVDMLSNSTVAASTSDRAILGITSSSLQITRGTALKASTKISFVPSTSSIYNTGNARDIQAVFDAGTASAIIDPIAGVPVYAFKIEDGADIYYGIFRITSVVPGTSVAYEYKIGSTYAQLLVLR